MRLKVVSMLAATAFAFNAAADEGFKISGDVASSIFIESGKGGNNAFPSTGAVGAGTATAENHGDFSVDMVEINLEKSMGNTGVVLGIGYGRIFKGISNTLDDVTGSPKSTLNLTNAYLHHKLGDTGLSFKVGRFASGIGYETYNYMDNMNYTRSYAFNYMNPFFFTGVAANYMINEMVDVGVVVANSTINTDTDENRSKVTGVNATVRPMEGLNVTVNYLMGKENDTTPGLPSPTIDGVENDTTRLNATVGYTMNNMYDFAVHYSAYNVEPAFGGGTDAEITSIALYAGAKMEQWGAGVRYEMLNDKDGVFSNANAVVTPTTPFADNKINTITATGWYNLDQNAVLKLEIASASADQTVFVKDDGTADDAMMTYGLGFLYRF